MYFIIQLFLRGEGGDGNMLHFSNPYPVASVAKRKYVVKHFWSQTV